MPPNSTPAPSGQSSNARRRPTTERIVPAVPLALTRPRPSKTQPKTQPKPELNVKAEDERLTPNGETTNGSDSPVSPPVVTNGGGHAVVEAADMLGEAVKDIAVVTPGSEGSAAMSLSAGATPEAPATASSRPSTPPPEAVTATVSPSSVRKQIDKFDMRHIRTELPPAFVPFAEQHTPRSAASSNSNRPQFLSRAHPTHPSVGSIVFGGQDSLTSSPAPPLSGGSAFPPPPFDGSQQPYSVPNGHAHHVSEPHGQRMSRPGYQQPHMTYNARHSHAQPSSNVAHHHPHAHAPFRYPPREVFTPTEPYMLNGSNSPSGSQASSGAHDNPIAQSIQSPTRFEGPYEQQTIRSSHTHPRPSIYSQNIQQQPPPPFPNPGFNADLDNADALRGHVLSEFSNAEFADCQLRITDDLEERAATFSGHKIILSRSPALSDLIRTTQSSTSKTKDVKVRLQGRYNRVTAFVEALKYLYGGPLLQLSYHRAMSSAGEQSSPNRERMESALQHIAIGCWLKMPALASRGVEVATGLLHWDTILPALTFALEGGLSHFWTVDDGSEDRASTSSSDDSLSKSEHVGSPTYDPHSTHLLHRILDFTVHWFPYNFYLDSSAPQLAFCPRLPSIPQGHESRPSRSDPRLSQIRFGEVPIEDHQRPSFATTTISSIMLSLPFVLLKWVLEHGDLAARLGPDTAASIMRQVVAEREVRRIKAEKARAAGQLGSQTDSSLTHNLLWEESVEPSAQLRAGSRLCRRKKEIDTPPSSGACSEKNK